MRLFATCAPGLGRMLRRQLEAVAGIEPTGTGFDGRADIVFFESDRPGRAEAMRCRLADEVFAEIGQANRAAGGGPGPVAIMGWQADAVQRALSAWADEVRPLAGSMTFRVTARVLGEARFRRSALRQALAAVIAAARPRWKFADPAQLQICIREWHDGQYVVGLRLDDGAGERPGALARSVAAAMIQLAGPPGRARQAAGTMLDPCCGTGVILAEAIAAGWTAEGGDIDPDAVEAALRNAAGASVQLGDARALLLPDECAGACVSWLPGRVPGGWPDWAGAVLAELSRVTRSGGSVVVLAPELPRPAIPGSLRLRRQVPVRLPGNAVSIWVFHRA